VTSAQPQIHLAGEQAAFARGGNRLIFIHPEDADACIKVQRPDRSPARKRAERRFPRNLRPLRHFDDNWQEQRVYRRLQHHIGSASFDYVPRLHGPVATNLGPGLCSELIRDDDGAISLPLKQYLWLHGQSAALTAALAEFHRGWQHLGMPSRALLLHNLVVQCQGGVPARIVVIDGLGWPQPLTPAWWCRPLARRKARKRLAGLQRAILRLLEKRERNEPYGVHGWLEEAGRDRT
jgi:hypothetical protein